MGNVKIVTAPFNLAKLKRDIERATKLKGEEALNSFDKSELQEIGDAVVDEMKLAISKGISPIADAGRFPGYKWAEFKNAAKKTIRGQSDKKRRRKSTGELDQYIKNKYPYSAQKHYPDKRERPVNLFLSGDFLDHLIAKVSGKKINIGFWDSLSSKKEKGHREGVNDQPERPIIPQGDEDFSPSIYRRLVKTIREIAKRKF